MPKLFIAKTEKINGQFETNNIMEALDFLVKMGGATPHNVIHLNDRYRESIHEGTAELYGLRGPIASLEWYGVDDHLEYL